MDEKFRGKVYSVGDGFCYEGITQSENNGKYHFVIDCGSQAPKKKILKKGELTNSAECDERLKEISVEILNNDKHINLFVLTHLHVDHYNGMKYLFSSGIPDTIIMPYLYPEERLYIIISNNMDEEDRNFFANPYSITLQLAREKNPDAKLVLIRGNWQDENEDNQDEVNSNEYISWGRRYEGEENILEIENLNPSHVKVVHAASNGVIIRDYIWKFKFFNHEADEIEIDILKKIAGSITAKNLYDKLTDPTEFKRLKKQYSHISIKFYMDFNNTSIVTYHAPINMDNRCGTLITGDINLNYKIASLLNYFRYEMDKIGLFSIPHHGSDNNWNIELIDSGELNGSICFASTHNYYTNRMTTKMMSDLRCHNIGTLIVDENRFNEIEHVIYNLYYHCHIIRVSCTKYKNVIVLK